MFDRCIIIASRLVFNKIQFRNYVSALYLTGDKAKENFAILVPYMNFDEVFENPSEMQNNLKIRGMDINFNELIKKYENYKSIRNKKSLLEEQREEIAMMLKTMNLSYQKNEEQIDELKTKGKLLREKLKDLKDELFPTEEDFIDNFLKLPNEIHPKVHSSEHIILYCSGSPPSAGQNNFKSHTEYTDLIKFKNDSYYLLEDAAMFDTEFPLQCVKYFLNNFNFIQMSNPDFARTILLEAATIDKESHNLICEESSVNKINLLHLVGGASLPGFLGFIAKTAIFSSNLPLRLLTFGRQYYSHGNEATTNLFKTNQTNAVQIFSVCLNRDELEDEFKKILDLSIDVYKKLDIHFRIILSKATDILPAETLRAVIQLYSPIYSKYIDIGHVSNYSNFISRRLLFNLRDRKVDKFPYILSGTIIDSAKIIACLLENSRNLCFKL